MKKVISFALWGNNTLYTKGAIRNAVIAPDYYPGWTMRVYYDKTVPQWCVDELVKLNCEMVLMPASIDVLGMFWRFRPMFDDPTIERFIVRDCDSLFTAREVWAVDKWIESGKAFHIIRDCESHGMWILGGTWGAIPGCVPNFKELMWQYLGNLAPCNSGGGGLFRGADQEFLSRCIWPYIENNQLAHVRAGLPKIKFTGREVDLPELTDNHYIGMVC